MIGFAMVALSLLALGASAITNPLARAAGVGFARAIMRAGAIAGLILWPMLWTIFGTTAFYYWP
jgi:hypothetical protein